MEQTTYEKLGEENLTLLIERFYDLVQENKVLSPLFLGGFDEIRRKQKMFLTQFLGGPQLFTNEFGHPKMKMRHLPHKITNEGKDEWLNCMKEAISTLPIDKEFKTYLYAHFPHVAQHMVNS